jgi:carboxypeptidase C (cathepsin A)
MCHCTFPDYVDHEIAFVSNSLIPLSTKSVTGFIPVSGTSEVFYWLFYAEERFPNKPVLVWVQGQIGVSSLLGSLREFTPEWTEHFNLLFVDSPVGTGFSNFTKATDLATSSSQVAEQTVKFLTSFFERHVELKTKNVILAGEDFAGHTLPITAHLALNRTTNEVPFKVSGMAIGNGHTHAPIQVITKAESAAIFGLVDGPSLIEARQHAWAASVYSVDGDAVKSLDERNKLEQTILASAEGVNMANIGQQLAQSEPVMDEIQKWMNRSENLHAIGVHAKGEPFLVKSAIVFDTLKNDIMTVMWDHIPPLLDAHIPTLWYQGQLDWVDGVFSNEAWINALEWSGKTQYAAQDRTKWSGGYMRSFGPLNEAMIQGAGHLPLVDANEKVLELYVRLFSGKAKLAENVVETPLV